jgi:predicted dehydrogenase
MESSKPVQQGASVQTRRAFMGTATALTAASYQRVMGANDRIGIGFIGFGLIGKQHVADFKKMTDIDIVGMCDCYKPRLDEGLAYVGNPKTQGYSDFRKMYENKDITGVVISTPDHWHALATIMGCAAGKDIYVEKPQTLFIDEGKWMVQAARKYKRVCCAGTQRRHGAGVKEAKKVIQSGILGKLHSIRISAARNIYPGFGVTPVENPPADFDYDMWLGPAKKTPYRNHRGIYHFRWMRDFSGGQMTNLGAHQIDQVLFTTGAKGPTLAMCTGGRFALDNDDGDTPDLQQASWVFPEGFILSMDMREANACPAATLPGQGYLGTKGNLMLSGSYTVTSENKLRNPENDIPRFLGHPVGGPKYDDSGTEPFLPQYATAAPGRGARGGAPPRGAGAPPAGAPPAAAAGGVASDNRYGLGGEDTMMMNERDWVDAMRARKDPLVTLEEGHRVAIVCHLANMSMDLKRAIQWDPVKQEVVGDKEAAALCRKPYREPWEKVLRSLVTV